MIKEKRILRKNIVWFILGVITYFFINVVYVKADTVIAPVKYVTDTTTLSISNKKGVDLQLSAGTENNVSLDIKQIVLTVDYDFSANVIYQIEISTPTQNLININNISILASDNTCTYKSITDSNIGYPKIRFSCPYDTNYVTIGLSNLSDNNITSSYNFRWNYTHLSIVNENVVDLNPVIDGQAGINDNITNSTNTITGEIDDMESAIIDSNKETQDVIENQFNNCSNSNIEININNKNSFNTIGYIDTNNTIQEHNDYRVSNYIGIKGNSTYKIIQKITSNDSNYNANWNLCWYDENKNILSCEKQTTGEYVSPSNAKYIRINAYVISGRDTIITGIVCSNKIDETNDKLDGIQGALTDSSEPNTSGLENSAGWLPAGPLDSILNLPLTMLNSLTNSLGKTCSPLNLTLPYVNKQIQIPCLSAIFAKINGVNSLWTWVGTIASVLILYNYLLNLYAWVDRVLTLRAEFDEAMGADLANWGRL